jgi:hypothetical protein
MSRLDQSLELVRLSAVPLSGGSQQSGGDLHPEHLEAQPQLVCVWCEPSHVLREGNLPASHGMCPDARARFEAEDRALEAYGAAFKAIAGVR